MLKLLLVPGFLLAVSLAGMAWGPRVAGWLAELPIVAGPLLFLVALERGPDFAAATATTALAALAGSVAFNVCYARTASVAGVAAALAAGLAGWAAVAVLVVRLPALAPLSFAVALAAIAVGPRLVPVPVVTGAVARPGAASLAARLVAGAALTFAVTEAAGIVGPTGSGLLTQFPMLGTVLAVSSQAGQGAAFAILLLRGMIPGLSSIAVFLLVLATALPGLGTAAGFGLAIAAALVVQAATRPR